MNKPPENYCSKKIVCLKEAFHDMLCQNAENIGSVLAAELLNLANISPNRSTQPCH
jgi:hypothetical protein